MIRIWLRICKAVTWYQRSSLFSACLPGTFGADCSQVCTCPHGTSCHHISGECGCPPGYTGNSCEQSECSWTLTLTRPAVRSRSDVISLDVIFSLAACLPGTYGLDCNQVCQCSERNQLCHPASGECYCAPGYSGPKCDLGKMATLLNP